jgi:nucleotide-binding universal stress UspA family protein
MQSAVATRVVTKMFNKILIPLDGSEHSLKIVGWATGLARALKAQIILFSVVDPEDIDILWAVTKSPEKQAKAPVGDQ